MFLVCLALLKSFGARLKDEATSPEQMASASVVAAQSKPIAFEIQLDDSEDLYITPDINQENCVTAFIKAHTLHEEVSNHILARHASQWPEDGLEQADRNDVSTTGLPLLDFRVSVTSSRAHMELRLSLQQLRYPSVLHAVEDLVSGIAQHHRGDRSVDDTYEIQATFDLKWDPLDLVTGGKMDIKEKA